MRVRGDLIRAEEARAQTLYDLGVCKMENGELRKENEALGERLKEYEMQLAKLRKQMSTEQGERVEQHQLQGVENEFGFAREETAATRRKSSSCAGTTPDVVQDVEKQGNKYRCDFHFCWYSILQFDTIK